jgi:hypothetical protein
MDTVSVIRGIGARAAAYAAIRRAASTLRGAVLRVEGMARARPSPEHDVYVRALRVSASPLAEGDDGARFATLERERSDAVRAIRDRARAAAETVDELGDPALAPCELDDPRLSWEPHRLARLVHVAAGTRCALSEAEEAYLRARLERGLLAWIEANPPSEIGAWESPLEVALRAWNLWVALSLARPVELSASCAAAAAATLVEHGRSIETRLEDRGLVVGSHLVGELVGLYACGAALDLSGREAERWRRAARIGLAREARRQVLGDGAGAEASTAYGVFVCELWLAALAASRAVGEQLSAPVLAAASAMLAHLGATIAPDGTAPRIGDDDGSAVLPPAERPAGLVIGLLPLAGSLCGARVRQAGVPWSEEAAWLSGAQGWERWRSLPAIPAASSFAASELGIYGGRRGGAGGDLVVLRAGSHGLAAGGHAHNDALSIALWFDGTPVVIDPGTGIYLGRRALRDRFRGVAAHATICIDGEEPSPILDTRPFALPDRAQAIVVAAGESPREWWCEARHDGYRRRGVRCVREVRLDREAGRILLRDRLERRGRADDAHDVVLSFPVAAAPAIDGDVVRIGSADAPVAWMRAEAPGLAWRIDPAPVSPRYGAIVPGWTVRLAGERAAPATFLTVIAKRRESL